MFKFLISWSIKLFNCLIEKPFSWALINLPYSLSTYCLYAPWKSPIFYMIALVTLESIALLSSACIETVILHCWPDISWSKLNLSMLSSPSSTVRGLKLVIISLIKFIPYSYCSSSRFYCFRLLLFISWLFCSFLIYLSLIWGLMTWS